MPSDVNVRISEVTEIFARLKNDHRPMTDDAIRLFKLAKELRETFEAAEKASRQWKDIFDNIQDKARNLFEKFDEGKPDISTGQGLKPDLTKPLGEIEIKLNSLENERAKLSPLGVSETQGPAASPAPVRPAVVKGAGSGDGESEAGDTVQMQRFFTNVTESLIGAQKELNKQSLEYAARLDPRIPPAYYAIPSLKAEMKVGFSESKGKGMNLILFSSREQRENYGESTLSFELVSAPPPPGSNRPDLPPGFLLVGDEKRQFLDRVHALAKTEQLDVELTENFEIGKALAAVLRYAGKAGETKYLIFWPSQTKKDLERENFWRSLLVLHLSEKDGALQPDASVFDKKFFPTLEKKGQYLLIPDTAGLTALQRESPEGPKAMINCFGDAVFKALTILDEYYKA